MKNHHSNTRRELLNYMPPEFFDEEKHLSFAADIWSLGCVMHEGMSGKVTFDGENEEEIKENIVSLNYSPLPEDYSE